MRILSKVTVFENILSLFMNPTNLCRKLMNTIDEKWEVLYEVQSRKPDFLSAV